MSDWSDNAQRAGHEIERLTEEVAQLRAEMAAKDAEIKWLVEDRKKADAEMREYFRRMI